MCGITGFFSIKDNQDKKLLLEKMSSALLHRGPDEFGQFINQTKQLYIAHQRLSILELSEAGSQPMKSRCGRYIIAFNGEIYNFRDLRSELEAYAPDVKFRGHSDTEVLLTYISIFGLDKTLPKLNGMFAFSLYDSKLNKIIFARDRFGEKPLYIYSDANSFAFSSELKPIEIFTQRLSINHSAVDALFRFSYIPAPFSIYNEVFKLLPGHRLDIDLNDFSKIDPTDSKPYWQVVDSVSLGLKNRSQFTNVRDAITETESVLKKSVEQRMISDVPLGAFLSGGIDSTCITALMQAQSSHKIKTFSIGFHDKQYNEAQHAKVVAGVLGTEHHELYLNPNDMLDSVHELPDIYDEPFADSSQLPTIMVSRFAKKHVTVALTGDSGDEVFCGYNRYRTGQKVVDKFGTIPLSIRNVLGNTLSRLSPTAHNRIFSIVTTLIPKISKYKNIGDKAHKFYRILDFKNEVDLYNKLIQTWPETAVTGEIAGLATDIQDAFNYAGINFIERMMWQDSIGYMQNDILTKVDRASMSVSLETRVPFLDNHVYQHAWNLPLEYKLYNGQTKYPLRNIVSKYIPDSIMDRPKSGFGAPIGDWLRNELREWAESLLSSESLGANPFIDSNKIRKLWRVHLTGKQNHQHAIWNVLMFLQWQTRRLN